MIDSQTASSSWTFLTNHTHVLLCLARDASMRIREIADEVGITERAVQRIIADLDEGGYIKRMRDGRNNSYEINYDVHLRHPLEARRKISDLIHLVDGTLDEQYYTNTEVDSSFKMESLTKNSTEGAIE